MKRFCSLLAALFFALPAWALSLGSLNIEYFSLSGQNPYSSDQMATLASRLQAASVDLVALQEIEGRGTMNYFTLRFLPQWRFAGNDTQSNQDLFFLWDSSKIELVDGPVAFYGNASFDWEGKSARLFDRPPLVATFREKATGMTFTVVNVHLKSGSTRGKGDKQDIDARNRAKRSEQIERLNRLVANLKGVVFIAGDYNDPNPQGLAFPLATLTRGYSYDNRKSNLDYIGYQGFRVAPGYRLSLREVEMSLPSRSRGRSEHPDHDLVILDVNFAPQKGERP